MTDLYLAYRNSGKFTEEECKAITASIKETGFRPMPTGDIKEREEAAYSAMVRAFNDLEDAVASEDYTDTAETARTFFYKHTEYKVLTEALKLRETNNDTK